MSVSSVAETKKTVSPQAPAPTGPKTVPDDKERDRSWIDQLITQIQQRKFYGRLVIVFEGGNLCRAVKEESLKPPRARMRVVNGPQG